MIQQEDHKFEKKLNKKLFEDQIEDIKNNKVSEQININPFQVKIFCDEHLAMYNINRQLVVNNIQSRLDRITVLNDDNPLSILHQHKKSSFVQNGQKYSSIQQCCLSMKYRFCTAAIKELLATTQFEELVRIDSKYEDLNVKTDDINLVETINKIQQYRLQNEEELTLTLLGTFNSQIKIRDIHDNIMGDGFNCTGENIVGKFLMQIRDKFMLKELQMKNIIVQTES